MKLSKIQKDVLVVLRDAGTPLDSVEIKERLGKRFIGVTTWNMLRDRDCIVSAPGLKFQITDIGITAATTGIKP